MAFNHKNPKDVQNAYDFVYQRVMNYYSSSLYSSAWTRYERRIKAYYCRPFDDQPKWRSKLFLPTFFLGCTATLAQFKQAYASDPFIFVKARDDGVPSPEMYEKAQIAHLDLNYEIAISGFKNTSSEMDWYLTLFGTAVGREYLTIKTDYKIDRQPNIDQFGLNQGMVITEQLKRTERTCTDIIHPLNFAHDPTKRNFIKSSWGSVRFLMHIRDIYKMLGHEFYYQPGVKQTLEKLNSGGDPGWTHSRDTIYSEHGDEYSDRLGTVVVYEYVGDLNFSGNEKDTTLYCMLWIPAFGLVLKCLPHWGRRIPYWKKEAWYDVDGPYGVDPCGMLLPINLWENSSVNQYIDFTNSAMKYLYVAYPDNVRGGLSTLINAIPGGIVPVISDQVMQSAIQPLQTNYAQIQHMGNVLQLIEKYRERSGPSSNLRGRGSNQLNDTATGISLMAHREDLMIYALMDGADQGIVDGMNLKLQHEVDWFKEPKVVQMNNKFISYYPYEIDGDYTFEVKRSKSDIEAGKEMSFLKLITSLNNFGIADPSNMIKATRDIGVALGVDDIDSKLPKITPPEVGGTPGMPAPPGAEGAPPSAPPPPPQEGTEGAQNLETTAAMA
jgi:hypothetical protein